MTLTMSIDPGVKCACAVWYSGQLVSAKLLGGQGGNVHTCLEPVVAVVELAREIGQTFDTIVIEKPQVYGTAQQKGRQSDIVNLAILVGALTSALAPYTKSVLHVLPSQWKGQTPKDVQNARDWAKLTDEEQALVELPRNAKGKTDVKDAIGIGLWRWGNKR